MQKIHGQCTSSYLPIRLPSTHLLLFQPLEIFVDDETKLTLHGLQQYFVKMDEVGKNRKLNELLDTLEFNQVCFRALAFCLVAQSCQIGRHLREIRRPGNRAG
jgi:hypothetical protein